MDSQPSSVTPTRDLAASVRRNVPSAAVAAALMLYFGFVQLAEPTGTDLFHRAGWVFYHTLRIGGVAMAVVAAWSLWGNPVALIVDAAASAAIGVLFIVTGALMLIDGGEILQTVINALLGGMFLSAAVRNRRAYFQLRSLNG